MQENKIIKLIFKFSLISLIALSLLFILNYFGIFNYYYKTKFRKVSSNIKKIFSNFMDKNIKITKSIGQDPILKGTILQYNFGENILLGLKVMNMYKESYAQIKTITIFNYEYNIITSDIGNLTTFHKVPKNWFLMAQNKDIYISPIYYNKELNLYIISFIFSIKNVVDEVMGFIKVDFSIEDLLKELDKFSYVNVIIIDTSKSEINFIYPLDAKISFLPRSFNFDITQSEIVEVSVPGFRFAYGGKLQNSNMVFITVPSVKFFGFTLYLKILLLFLIFMCILSYIYIWLDKKQKLEFERKQKFNGIIQSIVNTTQQAEKHNITLMENIPQSIAEENFYNTKDLNYGNESIKIKETNVENKNETKSKKEDKKVSSLSDDFKIIEPS